MPRDCLRDGSVFLNFSLYFYALNYRFSSLPGLLYYAQHGYTSDAEVNVDILKRKFGKNYSVLF